MDTIKNFFKKHGIKKKDFPKGFLIFNGLGFITYGSILALSYRYRPLYNAFKQPKVQDFVTQLKNTYPDHYGRINIIMETQTKNFINHKMVQKFIYKYKLDGEKLVYSMGETSIMYKMGLPISIPLQFWLTVHMLKKPNSQLPNL
jgi:hypothetical protein